MTSNRELRAIEKATHSGGMWPSVSDAAATLVRRSSASAEPYELIWRLIHLWEAMSLTLASVATTRLKYVAPECTEYLKIREL